MLGVKGIWTGGVAGDVPVPADYNGDGDADVVIFRGGAWLFFDYATGVYTGGVWTGPGPAGPVPMDYDGDGRADFTVYDQGAWHFFNRDGTYLKGIWTGGVAGDKPVPGDYDGVGRDEPVIFRGGAWLFFDFATGANYRGVWTGATGTLTPVPMDYDGDHTTDFTVYAGGAWHFYNDDGSYLKGIWTGGVAGDIPASGDFNHTGGEDPSIYRSGAWLFFDDVFGTVNYHLYYPFGEEATAFNQDTIRAKFTGHERDLGNPGGAGDDLDYMHARHCSPVTGRFLSADKSNGRTPSPQSWNRYAYALGNPVRLVDPNGLEPLDYSVAIFMGGFFGMDLSGVQVHGGWFARSLTRALQAEAFTAGNHIFFSEAGWSAYKSIHNISKKALAIEGISLTAHELTHTTQSRQYGLTALAVRYLYYLARVGYWNNPFEVAARATGERIEKMLLGDPDFLDFIQSGPATQPSPVLIGQTPGVCCWTVVTSIFDGPLGGLFGLFEFGGELWIDGINLTGVLTTTRPRG